MATHVPVGRTAAFKSLVPRRRVSGSNFPDGQPVSSLWTSSMPRTGLPATVSTREAGTAIPALCASHSATASQRTAWISSSLRGNFAIARCPSLSRTEAFGRAPLLGSEAGVALHAGVVGIAADPAGLGYWLVAADGGVFAFGDAGFYGSLGATKLNGPIVAMTPTPDGKGYWLVASDGGIFTFGDATFLGSTGAIHLNQPIVGMAATPDGKGYWLVASDGGIFSFGDAAFFGSTGAIHLNRPIVGMGGA